MADSDGKPQEFSLGDRFDPMKPANDASGNTATEIGDVMPDGHPHAGWIYMGPDDETGKDFYAAPKDESGVFDFIQAAKQAVKDYGRVPTKSQLDKIYRNKDKGALKGTFNESGSDPAGSYWAVSSKRVYGHAWAQRFSDGYQSDYLIKVNIASLRCVR